MINSVDFVVLVVVCLCCVSLVLFWCCVLLFSCWAVCLPFCSDGLYGFVCSL